MTRLSERSETKGNNNARRRRPFTAFTLPFDLLVIALGTAAALWRPSPAWVESNFTNGYYPPWEHFWSAVTSPLPFALGDLIVIAGAAGILGAVVFVRPVWRSALGIAALLALYALWFYAGWGFGYDRAPLQTRTAYDAQRVNAATIDALRKRVVANMNRLAPIAHALRRREPMQYADLRYAWTPVVMRLGDTWTPHVSRAKFPLGGWFMDETGTSGFTNPLTLETQLAPDLMWFERPFAQAHEWSHVAGYNRENEANYIAVLACLRDRDPVAQYSGWLELFLYLPPLQHYPHRMFVPQVWRDFAAIRARDAHFLNLNLSRFSWHVYNNYLKSNHVAAGVQSYQQVAQLMTGIPLDKNGLPLR